MNVQHFSPINLHTPPWDAVIKSNVSLFCNTIVHVAFCSSAKAVPRTLVRQICRSAYLLISTWSWTLFIPMCGTRLWSTLAPVLHMGYFSGTPVPSNDPGLCINMSRMFRIFRWFSSLSMKNTWSLSFTKVHNPPQPSGSDRYALCPHGKYQFASTLVPFTPGTVLIQNVYVCLCPISGSW